jgi:putative YphP/YqiW family bacilliredoxin
MNNINSKPPIYDPVQVQPMREELTGVGFEEVATPEMFEEVLSAKDGKTVLVVINSVCGCAAGSARPGVTLALQNKIIPDRFVTAFAGMERDAIDYLREKYLAEFPPSSPSIALFKDGEVKFMMPRHEIEGNSPVEVAETLKDIFNENCSRTGPSIPVDEYEKMVYIRSCGSASLN